ncbi:cupin domain-containing protein [Pseudoalteromonas luteoviolacea]|uniref:cupin domain-containing protein n=1 Tax=Pseudoalteromonas luteoviolacea TaxID=43657 RepID=UPI00115035DE|nr:cupin domain-containing protein [Pseudoalteromonas luteoviolacea]TQF67997.1 cupin domain-containing protein [Pseudoalteromonas luteoviolacea]
MSQNKQNVFHAIPNNLQDEFFEVIAGNDEVKIERIVSKGHTSPDEGWYDQAQHEWVMVLQGAGELTFEDGRIVKLEPGEYINIPAHCKHKVSWTLPGEETVWLAVFYY